MCGIVGIINKNKAPVDYNVLYGIADVLNHRGPDDEGFVIDSYVGLAHKRLSIIDLKTGHQPMEAYNSIIIYNGEIYNYIELRNKLKKKGYQFRTGSDTEVILNMYNEFGEAFIKQLNGMFAFVIYDKSKKKIVAGRDHFGIKPIYYINNSEHLIFASEIKAILAHPEVTAAANHSAIHEYIVFQYLLYDTTLFKGIQKINPGCYIVYDIEKNVLRSEKYWNPDFRVDVHHTEEYFTEKLRYLLKEAIHIQLRSDVPLGTYLSGGIDSSLVTLLAASDYGSKLKTFTGAFVEGKSFDETEYSECAADICSAEKYTIYPTEQEFIQILPKLIYYLDEPAAGPGLFPQYMVSKLASEHVKVVLGGQGGDEIYGGYTRYVIAYLEQALKGAVFETNEEGEHIVSLKTILPNLPYIKQYIPMLKDFWKQGVFEPMDRRYFSLINRSGNIENYFNKDFTDGINREEIFIRFSRLFNHPDTQSYYNKMTHFDMAASLPALLQVEDRMSMANSIESRVPLLDYRIVELVASMPPALKFKGAEMKYILKKAFSDVIPAKILNRKDKMGFPVPIHIWIKKDLKSFVFDTLTSQKARERDLYNLKAVEALINSERPFGRQLWGILCLELWFKQFFDEKVSIKKRKEEYEISAI